MKKGQLREAAKVEKGLDSFDSLQVTVGVVFPPDASPPLSPRVDSSSPPFFRVFEPWDLLRGKCVFKDRLTLMRDVDMSCLSHWAPNCATFSRAREIPIPGVLHAPRPIRSTEYPEGIPGEMALMKPKSKRKLDDDTEMADLSATSCLHQHKRRKFFTLEHPGRSIALDLESWKNLKSQPGVETLEYTTCMFEGSRRRKSRF